MSYMFAQLSVLLKLRDLLVECLKCDCARKPYAISLYLRDCMDLP
jgi:hypothetical protein